MAKKKQGDLKKVIRQLQIARAFLYTVAAVAAGVLVYNVTVQVTANYVTKDSLASSQNTVFTPAVRTLFNWPIVVDIVLFLAVSAVFAMYQVTKGKTRYEKQLKNGVTPLRWIDFGISIGILYGVLGVIVGIHDLVSLKIMGGAILTTCLLGWLAEKQNVGAKKPVWGAYVASALTGLAPWVFIIPVLVHTYLYGLVRLPWHAYALTALVATGAVAIAVNKCYGIRKYKAWKNYPVVERNYLIIDLVLKLSAAAILIVGLKK